MKDIVGIINLSESEEEIKELTHARTIASITVGGRYRIIDFVLSNMVNAEIENISIFPHGKCRSLVEHLGTGKEWDLNRNVGGLSILNPTNSFNNFKGDIKNFKYNIDKISTCKENYVLLARSYMICNINYLEVLKHHKESKADITIVYKNIKKNLDRFINCDTLNLNEEGRVVGIGKNIGNYDFNNISMEMYIMKKELLIKMIEESVATGSVSYLKEAIQNNISNYHVNGYRFDGYLSCINSIENYYKASMDLIDVDIARELFYKNGYIYTRTQDEPPTKYTETSCVSNSVLANGCIIEGRVDNCIIGRGVIVKKGAVVKNSVIMQKCVINENTALKNVILDKNVYISENKILCGDSKRPLVVQKNLKL